MQDNHPNPIPKLNLDPHLTLLKHLFNLSLALVVAVWMVQVQEMLLLGEL